MKRKLPLDPNRKVCELPVYFNMPFNYTVIDNEAKSVAIKTWGVKRVCNFHVDGIGKFLPYMTENHKTCLRSNCLEESLSDANLKVG